MTCRYSMGQEKNRKNEASIASSVKVLKDIASVSYVWKILVIVRRDLRHNV
jgi:hypothetical protein